MHRLLTIGKQGAPQEVTPPLSTMVTCTNMVRKTPADGRFHAVIRRGTPDLKVDLTDPISFGVRKEKKF